MKSMIDQILDEMVYEITDALPQSEELKKAEAESRKLFDALDAKIRGEEPHNMELSKLIGAYTHEEAIIAHDAFLNGLKLGMRLGLSAMGNGEHSDKGGLAI